MKEALSCGTFVQPVSEAVEHHALLPRGNQADDAALHRRPVVNVVLKNEDLDREGQDTDVLFPRFRTRDLLHTQCVNYY